MRFVDPNTTLSFRAEKKEVRGLAGPQFNCFKEMLKSAAAMLAMLQGRYMYRARTWMPRWLDLHRRMHDVDLHQRQEKNDTPFPEVNSGSVTCFFLYRNCDADAPLI